MDPMRYRYLHVSHPKFSQVSSLFVFQHKGSRKSSVVPLKKRKRGSTFNETTITKPVQQVQNSEPRSFQELSLKDFLPSSEENIVTPIPEDRSSNQNSVDVHVFNRTETEVTGENVPPKILNVGQNTTVLETSVDLSCFEKLNHNQISTPKTSRVYPSASGKLESRRAPNNLALQLKEGFTPDKEAKTNPTKQVPSAKSQVSKDVSLKQFFTTFKKSVNSDTVLHSSSQPDTVDRQTSLKDLISNNDSENDITALSVGLKSCSNPLNRADVETHASEKLENNVNRLPPIDGSSLGSSEFNICKRNVSLKDAIVNSCPNGDLGVHIIQVSSTVSSQSVPTFYTSNTTPKIFATNTTMQHNFSTAEVKKASVNCSPNETCGTNFGSLSFQSPTTSSNPDTNCQFVESNETSQQNISTAEAEKSQNSHKSNSPPSSFNTDAHSSHQHTPCTVKNVTRQSSPQQNLSDTLSFDSLSEDWVKSLLQESVDGDGVIEWFQRHGSLPASKKNILTKLVIHHELKSDRSKIIMPQRFSAMARAITKFFPCETEETYYIPPRKNTLNQTCRAKGKLYNNWLNKRRMFRAENIIIGGRNLDPLRESSDSGMYSQGVPSMISVQLFCNSAHLNLFSSLYIEVSTLFL